MNELKPRLYYYTYTILAEDSKEVKSENRGFIIGDSQDSAVNNIRYESRQELDDKNFNISLEASVELDSLEQLLMTYYIPKRLKKGRFINDIMLTADILIKDPKDKKSIIRILNKIK